MSGTSSVPNRGLAMRIIQALRSGSNCLDGTGYFSAGREDLFAAAGDLLEEVEISSGAVVRWVKGPYGHGKTFFLARLMAIARERNWVTTFVQVSARGQGRELHRFEEIYSAIVRNCLSRDLVLAEEGKVEPGKIPGWDWILDKWYSALRRQAAGRDSGDVPSFRLRDVIEQTMTSIRRKWNIHGSFAEALRQFALASADSDEEWRETLLSWFRAENVHSRGPNLRAKLRTAGILEPISRKNAKEMLRSLSSFLKYRGFGGILILIDEVENILQETPSARKTGYIILRELIDNLDARHGMTNSAMYLSATPDVFDAAKGIVEHPPLADRVLLPANQLNNPAPTVIDLDAHPLSDADLLEMGLRIVAVYEVARDWKSPPEVRTGLKDLLNARDPDLPVRMWVRDVVALLDKMSRSKAT